MEIGIETREEANRVIRHGLNAKGRLLQGRRPIPEPSRCMKCQRFGHRARECKSTSDICARCAGTHRTSTCRVSKTEDLKCANCEGAGHGAADRRCSTFQAKAKALVERMPNAGYVFYPTNDPQTWIKKGDTSITIQQPAPRPAGPPARWNAPPAGPRRDPVPAEMQRRPSSGRDRGRSVSQRGRGGYRTPQGLQSKLNFTVQPQQSQPGDGRWAAEVEAAAAGQVSDLGPPGLSSLGVGASQSSTQPLVTADGSH